jgi:3-keto-5-aminohexanoate cleavage enzyme
VRTGMEDNIRTSRNRLASGNDELVRIAVGLLERFGCRPATLAEARSSLGLRSA